MRKTIIICASQRLVSLWLIISINLCNLCYAQDIHFSQFYSTPLLLNPGATGAFDGKFRSGIHFRNQWSSLGSPYQTYSASAEMALLKKKEKGNSLGVGLMMFGDKAGNAALKRTQFNFSLSYNAKLNDQHNLALGLQGGYAQRSIDNNVLQWGSQYNGTSYDPDNIPPPYMSEFSNVSYIDLSSGLLWNYQISNMAEVSAGAAMFHLNTPQQSLLDNGDDKLDRKIIIHGQGRIAKRRSDIAYFPNFMFARQGSMMEINAGAMVRYMLKESSKYTGFIKGNAFYIGGNYRFKDAVIIAAALEIADWKLGLSYDINISGLRKATLGRGGFEISLVYQAKN